MFRILSVLVENNPGVLTRVASLFSRRGYNIDSLAVGRTEDPTISMTIVVEEDDSVIGQVTKQLHKLVDVIKVDDITEREYVDRELILIKPADAPGADHADRRIFRARIVDIEHPHHRATIEGKTGDREARPPSGAVRTGKIAMLRGSSFTTARSGGQIKKETDR